MQKVVYSVPTRYLERIRPRNPIVMWAWAPVIVLRVALVLTYVMYIVGGSLAFAVGVPIVDLNTPRGYLPIWAAIIVVSAAVSTIGSLSDRLQVVEKWASLALSAMLLAYVGGLNLTALHVHDIGLQFAGVISIIASILPVTRFVYLAAQTGKIKHDAIPRSG